MLVNCRLNQCRQMEPFSPRKSLPTGRAAVQVIEEYGSLTQTHKQSGSAGKTSALRTIILSSFPISQSRERRLSGEPEPFCGGSGGNGHCPIYLIRRVELRPARRCRREENWGLAATLSQTFSSNYNNI